MFGRRFTDSFFGGGDPFGFPPPLAGGLWDVIGHPPHPLRNPPREVSMHATAARLHTTSSQG